MKTFVAFIPEVEFKGKRKKKVAENLFLLPDDHKLFLDLKKGLTESGYLINGGTCLYYEGEIEGDLTSYELAHAYCLALSFFYKEGKASCRIIKELAPSEELKLYIDKYDKFGVDPDDRISFKENDQSKIKAYYQRILPHFATKEFNQELVLMTLLRKSRGGCHGTWLWRARCSIYLRHRRLRRRDDGLATHKAGRPDVR